MFAGVVSYLEVLRPHNMLAAAFAVVTGYHAAGGRGVDGVLSLALLCALATGGGNVANDVFDADIDRINKPRRPIPSQRLAIRDALAWYGIVSLAVVVLALWKLPLVLAVIVLAWQASLFLYARWLKRVWPAGNLAVAAIAASALLGGATAAGEPALALLPMAIAFAFVLCRELVKGAEDVEGDRAAGARTLAVIAGRHVAARVASTAMMLVAIALPLPAVLGIYRPAYAWIMLGLVVPALVAGAVTATKARDSRGFARVSRLLKLAMFAGLAAIAAGT
ncbi:MAG: geranylgeranylglycerol-phosphate geranylgeranyltransferase [Candidatus Latescibacteria bacterium]|nr:geranylgeranylglycerol-phosphate geranylgeranyltransferase [Candidatus Latescibacterota bacterium]